MAAPTSYLAVLKASYDYEPQGEDEIAIKEDQVIYLIERTDDEYASEYSLNGGIQLTGTSPVVGGKSRSNPMHRETRDRLASYQLRTWNRYVVVLMTVLRLRN